MRWMTLCKLGLFVALLVLLQGAKCPNVPELKDVEITVVDEEYVEFEFEARGEINAHSAIESIDIDELREDLEEMDIDLGEIDTILVSQIFYGVTEFDDVPGREIVNGDLTITRLDTDSSAVIFDDVNQAVAPLVGLLVPPPIEEDGVDFLNALFADVLAALKGTGPSEFEVQAEVSGDSEPQGVDTNFDWRIRVYYQISAPLETETVEF